MALVISDGVRPIEMVVRKAWGLEVKKGEVDRE